MVFEASEWRRSGAPTAFFFPGWCAAAASLGISEGPNGPDHACALRT
jgi:hypothetical protein